MAFEAVIHPELLDPEFELKTDNFYCTTCIHPDKTGFGWGGDYGVSQHVSQVHGVPKDLVVNGGHFVRGWQLRSMLKALRKENERLVSVFSADLRRILDVDDFLEECDKASLPPPPTGWGV